MFMDDDLEFPPPEDEVLREIVEVAHPFEVELNILVIVNHRLTLEGIAKSAREEVSKTRDGLRHEDPELIASQIQFVESVYEDMRESANHLAVVGLLTRLQHWVKRFAVSKHLSPKKRTKVRSYAGTLSR
jgi:hypothetical protein